LTAPVLARRAVALAPDHGSDRSRQPAKPSTRELECLSLSSAGKSSAEIAHLLELSEHTVNTHLRSAIDKLRAASRVQAVAEAMRRGWIS
jgi:DNA-binding CsgD family transcriptional regulator